MTYTWQLLCQAWNIQLSQPPLIFGWNQGQSRYDHIAHEMLHYIKLTNINGHIGKGKKKIAIGKYILSPYQQNKKTISTKINTQKKIYFYTKI